MNPNKELLWGLWVEQQNRMRSTAPWRLGARFERLWQKSPDHCQDSSTTEPKSGKAFIQAVGYGGTLY